MGSEITDYILSKLQELVPTLDYSHLLNGVFGPSIQIWLRDVPVPMAGTLVATIIIEEDILRFTVSLTRDQPVICNLADPTTDLDLVVTRIVSVLRNLDRCYEHPHSITHRIHE